MYNWQSVRHEVSRWFLNTGQCSSKLCLDSVIPLKPFECQGIANRITFLSRILNQSHISLANRALHESIKIGLRTGNGWICETLQILEFFDIKMERLSTDTIYNNNLLGISPEDFKENAYLISRQKNVELEICDKLCIKWVSNTQSSLYKFLNDKSAQSWFPAKLLVKSIEYDAKTKINVLPIHKFINSIYKQDAQVTALQFFSGNWRLNRMLHNFTGNWRLNRMLHNFTLDEAKYYRHDDNSLISVDNYNLIETTSPPSFRQKCFLCWDGTHNHDIETGEHLLFECVATKRLRDNMMTMIDNDTCNEICFCDIFYNTIFHNSTDTLKLRAFATKSTDDYIDITNLISDYVKSIALLRNNIIKNSYILFHGKTKHYNSNNNLKRKKDEAPISARKKFKTQISDWNINKSNKRKTDEVSDPSSPPERKCAKTDIEYNFYQSGWIPIGSDNYTTPIVSHKRKCCPSFDPPPPFKRIKSCVDDINIEPTNLKTIFCDDAWINPVDIGDMDPSITISNKLVTGSINPSVPPRSSKRKMISDGIDSAWDLLPSSNIEPTRSKILNNFKKRRKKHSNMDNEVANNSTQSEFSILFNKLINKH